MVDISFGVSSLPGRAVWTAHMSAGEMTWKSSGWAQGVPGSVEKDEGWEMVGEPPSSRMRPWMQVVGEGRVEMKYVDSMQPQEWPRRM